MRFSYTVTDLETYSSEPMVIEVEREEARAVAVSIAQQMLESMPRLGQTGMCVAIYDMESKAISIVPLDPMQ